MSVPAARPPDDAARETIRTRLGATLFVEAGAGSGKTSALVERVVALVAGDDGTSAPCVPMRAIAAITFTEKAAAELRARIRTRLAARAVETTDADVRARCRAALDELDAAAICTLHAFAQRILVQFPVEARLPPRLVVRDEISSRVAFEDRWRLFVDALLDDAGLQDTILLMLGAGVRLEHLRTVAEVLDDNWDLLGRVLESCGAVDGDPLPRADVDALVAGLDQVCGLAADCHVADDRLLARLDEVRAYADRLRGAIDDAELIEVLSANKPSFNASKCGRQGNWPDVSTVRAAVGAVGTQRDELLARASNITVRRVVAALARCTEGAVEERRRAGELDFHDLLVLARALLRDPEHGPRARRALRERWRCILVDEFQDTDPIQVELAALLGSDDPPADQWTALEVDEGRLFFVGDPKQSIYRFRRADIAIFLEAEQRFAGDSPVVLSANFRTIPDVLAWINHTFSRLIVADGRSQPPYRSLDPAREHPPEGAGPAVVLLGADAHDDEPDADTLREREAADVAAAIRTAIAERWQVLERELDGWRDVQLGDICVLLPARTSLPFLERALDDAGLPYRAESSSLVYGTREVRNLLAALRAIDDPSDELSLVTALRSSLFGCGDDDLFVYHVEHNGHWDLRRDPPSSLPADHPVVEAMALLRALHERRHWSTPSDLLEEIVRERHVLEVGALGGRFRDVARRVRFLVDQARAFADAAGGALRDYVAWAELQGTEGARVVEAVLPETDDDAVRIMTVHGAKGLEFPVVVCSGTTTKAMLRTGGVHVLFPPAGGCEIKLMKGVQTEDFELHKPVDEQMSFHEKLRLLYVACTRARDHLVVSVHRKARDLDAVEPSRRTHAELLWDAARDAEWSRLSPTRRRARRPTMSSPASAPLDPDDYARERAEAFARGSRRVVVAATTIAHRGLARVDDPGLAKDGRDLELPPWNKGRYGTAIGRAVHAVMQTVDLASGAEVDSAVAAQAAAEGVLGHEATVGGLVRSALASDVVRRAATRPHWRETYVGVPLDGITLEGYVDLVFRDRDGLVVVDYKTDSVTDEELRERLEHYRVQAAAYALAVGDATSEPVVRCVLCFLGIEGAREIVLDGDELAQAVAEVRTRVAAERDSPSPLPPLLPAEV